VDCGPERTRSFSNSIKSMWRRLRRMQTQAFFAAGEGPSTHCMKLPLLCDGTPAMP
jgi:hypothetical protein